MKVIFEKAVFSAGDTVLEVLRDGDSITYTLTGGSEISLGPEEMSQIKTLNRAPRTRTSRKAKAKAKASK